MVQKRPEFDPKNVNGENISQFIHYDGAEFDRDMGSDSLFYPFGKWGLHWFRRHITLETVHLLQQVTNRAAKLAPSYSAEVVKYGLTRLNVAKIVKVFESNDEYHMAFAIEEFVGGDHPNEKQYEELDVLLNRFSADMGNIMHMDGIDIPAQNTKLEKGARISLSRKDSVCTITDISRYLNEFRRR